MAQPPILNPARDAQFTAQKLAYTGTSAESAPYPVGPDMVAVACETAAFVVVGVSVVATSIIGQYVPANSLQFFKVPPEGRPWRVSVVQASTAGNAYIKPGNKE